MIARPICVLSNGASPVGPSGREVRLRWDSRRRREGPGRRGRSAAS